MLLPIAVLDHKPAPRESRKVGTEQKLCFLGGSLLLRVTGGLVLCPKCIDEYITPSSQGRSELERSAQECYARWLATRGRKHMEWGKKFSL